jgi:hypothetical protein
VPRKVSASPVSRAPAFRSINPWDCTGGRAVLDRFEEAPPPLPTGPAWSRVGVSVVHVPRPAHGVCARAVRRKRGEVAESGEEVEGVDPRSSHLIRHRRRFSARRLIRPSNRGQEIEAIRTARSGQIRRLAGRAWCAWGSIRDGPTRGSHRRIGRHSRCTLRPSLAVSSAVTASAPTGDYRIGQFASELTSTRTPGPMLELRETFCT